jgi:hypothetical protein
MDAVCAVLRNDERDGHYYQSFTIVIYNHKDSGQYYKTINYNPV